MKKVVVISTSMRAGSNSQMLAEQFAEGAKAAGNQVEFISLKGKEIKFCGGVPMPHSIDGNNKLQEAYELGKNV